MEEEEEKLKAATAEKVMSTYRSDPNPGRGGVEKRKEMPSDPLASADISYREALMQSICRDHGKDVASELPGRGGRCGGGSRRSGDEHLR